MRNRTGRGLYPLPKNLGTMVEEQEKQQRTRRAYAKRGSRSQTMMSFRIDNDLLEWLNAQSNKGRYINDLIRNDLSNVRST